MWTAHGRQHNKCIGWTLTRFLLPLCNHDLNFIQRKNFLLDQKTWIRQQDLSQESPCHIKQSQKHKYLQGLGWETGNATALTLMFHTLHQFIDRRRKKNDCRAKLPVILLVNTTEHIVVDVTPGRKIKTFTMFRESWMISDGSSLFFTDVSPHVRSSFPTLKIGPNAGSLSATKSFHNPPECFSPDPGSNVDSWAQSQHFVSVF